MEAVHLRHTWTRTALWKPYYSVVLGLGQRYGSRTSPSYLDSDSVMEAVHLRHTWTRTALWKPYYSVVLGLGQRYGSRTSPSYLDSDSVMEAVLLRRTWTRTALRKLYYSIVQHSVSPLHECGIDCQLTSDSCVRRRHSGAILRHFYSLLLTEL